ncbi:hypothetical protein AH03_27 [Erwinia phage AH03]|uniref:Uncharacterized protein n=1 Tax=Erwinia phage AH03 TaxID=2869568 RepID=A0AAE8BQR5_9CAUD|nr:hypothetical protein AH03_27 [Erwinia phage AH03]
MADNITVSDEKLGRLTSTVENAVEDIKDVKQTIQKFEENFMNKLDRFEQRAETREKDFNEFVIKVKQHELLWKIVGSMALSSVGIALYILGQSNTNYESMQTLRTRVTVLEYQINPKDAPKPIIVQRNSTESEK